MAVILSRLWLTELLLFLVGVLVVGFWFEQGQHTTLANQLAAGAGGSAVITFIGAGVGRTVAAGKGAGEKVLWITGAFLIVLLFYAWRLDLL